MSDFTIHTPDSAPAGSAAILADTATALGFVPNLYGTFAEAPATLEAYQTLGGLFDKTSFNATERQVVLLTASRSNDCRYCIAAHSVIAGMQRVPRDVVEAIRDDRPIADDRLEALRQFTLAVVENRGWLDAEQLDSFTAAGYGNQQVLEVILGVAMKTISNYTNHVATTPVDEAFSAETWQPVDER